MADTTQPLLYGPNGAPISSRQFLTAATNGGGSGPSWPLRPLDPLRKLVTYRDWTTTSFLSAKLFANFGVIKGGICQKSMYAVGNAWHPVFYGEAHDWGQEATRWLTEEWYPSCNVRGENFDFVTSLFLESITIDRDGDSPTLLTRDRDTAWPQIQLIPSRQIGQWGGGYGSVNDELVEDGPFNGAIIRSGVILNRQERPIGYRKLGNNRGEYEDIPANYMQHILEPEWSDGVRGLPVFSASIEDIRRIATSEEWEQQSMLIASALGLVEYNERGGPDLTDPSNLLLMSDDGTPSGLTTKTLFGGMVRYFKSNSGGKLEQFINQKPGEEWEKFQDRQIRKSFAGANWPYSMAWKSEASNGTVTRSDLNKAKMAVVDRQSLLTPSARRKLRYAVSVAMMPVSEGGLGILPPYPGKDKGGFLKWGFIMPPQISIDEGRDRDAVREDWKIGFVSLAEIAAQRGTTVEQIRKERDMEVRDLVDRAKAIAKEKDIEFEVALMLLQQPTANANVPGAGASATTDTTPINE